MKLLILSMKFYPASGGSALYAYNLALGLHNEDHKITLMAPYYSQRKMDDSQFPFKVIRMRMTSPGIGFLRILIASLYVTAYWIRHRPEAVWSTSFAGSRVLGWIPFFKMKYIGTIHGGGIHRRYPSKKLLNKFGDWLGMRFMQRADALVTVSEEAKKIFVNKFPDSAILKKIKIIYSSISFDENNFVQQDEARKKLPGLNGKIVLLTVARLVKAKGHDLVIRALLSLKNKFPNIVYMVAGEGPEKENLMKLAETIGVKDQVIFTGYVPDEVLEDYYGICDLFVMPGRWTENFVEGFGAVFIEAGIRGKAVIGTRIGGIPEAIADGHTGLVIEPENVSLLTETITRLLTDHTLRQRLAKNAVVHVKEHFSNAVMARNNTNLLKSL